MANLKYIGNGSYLPNVPARDLTAEEIKQLPTTRETLLASGLYTEEKPAKKQEVKADGRS